MFFSFKYDGTLCHHIVPGIIISRAKSKDDVYFYQIIPTFQSINIWKGMLVKYFDHKIEWILRIIYRMGSYDLVIHVFVGPIR